MSDSAASQIADYLVTGYWRDMGDTPGAFGVRTGDSLRVQLDFSRGADLQIVRLALAAWEGVSGLRFDLTGTAGAHDLRLTDAYRGAFATASQLPGGERVSATANVGRGWMDAYGTDTVSYYTQTWIHEIGHALGLGHAGPYNGAASWGDQRFALDSWQMSVMSYFSPLENPNVDAGESFVLSPMPADILAIHRLYGTPVATGDGADIYGYGGTAPGVHAAFTQLLESGRAGIGAMLTIHDTGGRDRIDLSRDSRDQVIDLTPGAFSDVLGQSGLLGIAHGTVIEDAAAGRGDDLLIGNAAPNRLAGGAGGDELRGRDGADRLDGGRGHDRLLGSDGTDRLLGGLGRDTLIGGRDADRLDGGGGRDVLMGRAGADVLIGGAGADRFVFRARDDHAGRQPVGIEDFGAGDDRLDLRTLGLDDMRPRGGPLGDGLLRAVTRGDDLQLIADLDGDGRADLRIILRGLDGLDADALIF
ncbi:M10 family metallopeptidase C-terminal domain-containing protein [Paracoccus spongiarum]|uniref:M10 family metallopeptidase C-terminal domain-containing protein n=1 Tax=Paracoccus spongiarum TaxID=3064387 RepID=A0ABT9JBD6_9RHOB|nr:M10 family metallopeptidase C-terminal domain-containing protein [Paracoccus sp. 2205BS29-5]MDP5307122.1 M10 family metallopeptidase C-terminal domain-containing protein [Paracoccus sp. 2205BS29-5]